MSFLSERFKDSPYLTSVLAYAEQKHAGQLRKGAREEAYIHHVVDVAEIVTDVTNGDESIIAAALLHDVIEDSDATSEEIGKAFGQEVADLVVELTDAPGLAERDRRQAQIDHAPHLSDTAKLIKIADKISNLKEMTVDPPASWNAAQQRAYLDWGEAVFVGLKGLNENLDELFRATAQELKTALLDR